jgi:hypothetical protein
MPHDMTGAPAAPQALPAAAAPAHRALRFGVTLLLMSLLLQRFALPLGGAAVSVVGPLGLGLMAMALAQGTLVLHQGRLLAWLALAALVVLGLAWRASDTGLAAATPSLSSLLQFLALSAAAVVTFAEPVDEARFFRAVNACFAVVALAGIVQFAAQAAGVSVFSFTGLLPDWMLFEAGYNLQIPSGIGDLLKSNGFFLVEPSVFSQMMALALIIEVLTARRLRHLAIFAAGLLLSVSGTGWIVIAAFILAAPFGLGLRGLALAAAIVVLVAGVAGGLVLLAPDIADAFAGRIDEVLRPGTSGHMRFVTPLWLLSDMIGGDPTAALLGIGPGAAERLTLAYDYDVNTPVKVAVEYGLPALLAYLLLFTLGQRTPTQGAILVPALVLFMVTGGYQQFPPMIFVTLLLISIPRLTARVASTSGGTT